MKSKTKYISAALAALALAAPVSCEKLDVVGNGSIKSFDRVLQRIPHLVSTDMENGGWSLSAPDGAARFIWSKNYAESPRLDAMLEFDAAPFIAAGLDPKKLPAAITCYNGVITLGIKLGQETLRYSADATPLASYEQIVLLKRRNVGYHGELDHYGVSLGEGNMFEWAKDMASNDKDIVFVLNPDPFIAAGADPAKIEGWVFAKVTVDDARGKPVQADKFLKPFDLL